MPVNSVRRNGSYAPLSAHYYKDDAIDEAGLDAELLYVRGLAFCADVLSDGFISDRQLVRFVGVGMDDATERATRLVAVELWEREDGGYRIRSWLDWNRSREEITERQVKDRQRKVKGATAESEPPPPDPPDGPPDDSNRNPNGIRVDSADVSGRSPDGFQPRAPASARAPRHSTPRNDTTASATADAATKPDIDAGFDDFWAAYPRRVKKQDALKAWRQVRRTGITVERLVAAAKTHADRWRRQGKETEFVPYPASWLRGGSYDDEAEPTRLTVVPDRSADPADAFADLRRRAAGVEAARLLGIPYLVDPKPPSDPMHPRQWDRDRAIEWIDAHAAQIRAALTERRTG